MMRNLFLITFILSFAGSISNAFAVNTNSSLSDVLYALSTSRDDLPNGFVEITSADGLVRKTDKILNCVRVSKEEIISHYDRGVQLMQDYYYDEDLAYDESREAFIEVLGKKEFQSCLYQEDLDSPYYQRITKIIYRPLSGQSPAFLFEEGQR